jgi:hypothetical protein
MGEPAAAILENISKALLPTLSTNPGQRLTSGGHHSSFGEAQSHPLRPGTGKVGFVNISVSKAGVGTGFSNAFNSIGNGATKFAAYPGAGLEGFWGLFGLRLDVGDEIYLSDGTFDNRKVTFGPLFRF